MEDLKKILIRAGLAVLILISLLLSFAIGQQQGKRAVLRGLKPQVDTLFILPGSAVLDWLGNIFLLSAASATERNLSHYCLGDNLLFGRNSLIFGRLKWFL